MKKIINKIREILKKNVNPENYIYEFVTNYYLSSKLKTNSFEKIVKRFEDENIIEKLKCVYEDNNNYIEKFSHMKDFTLDEIIEIISGLSEYAGRFGGENITANSIIDLSLRLLNLNEEDKLLDIGSGLGITLLKASNVSNVSGIEINLENFILSCLVLDLFDIPIEQIVNQDVFTYDLSKFNANKIFINMPIGLKIPDKKLEEILKLKFNKSVYKEHIKSTDASWVLALDIIENIEYEKFVMLIDGNPLYSDNHKEIRKILIDGGKIEAVIALPSNLLAYTAIPIYIVIFGHGNESIKFIDATKLYSDVKYRHVIEEKHIREIIELLNNKDSSISKTVDCNRLIEEDYIINPLRYTIEEFPFQESISLKDVVKSINRGHTIRKKDLDIMISNKSTNYQYLMSQNFQDGIVEDNLPYLKNLREDYNKFFLKDNSVIVSRLAPFRIGTVGELKTNVLVNGNLFFLEIDANKVDKDFLAAYLQSNIGLREIQKYVKGSTVKTISIKDLEKIKIPKISMEKQIKVGEKFRLLNEELKMIKQRSKEIEKERLNILDGLKIF